MTEKEVRQALFDLRLNYMMKPPKERLESYDEYQKRRAEIRKELANSIRERIEKQQKTK